MNEDIMPREAALYKLWERIRNMLAGKKTDVSDSDWNEQTYYLSQSGVGMEEALNFLYNRSSTFDEFLNWLQTQNIGGSSVAEYADGNVLTAEDHAFWDANGYLVVKNMATSTQCAAARDAIWKFLGADPENQDSWYRQHDGKKGMMLSFFQHAALADIRNSATIRKVYQELYGHTDIYLLVDKVSFNAPETSVHKFLGSHLHWDVSLQLPIPFVLQGLLYLNDVPAHEGAFHCVPGFHNKIGEWLAFLPADANAREAAEQQLKPTPVPGNAGDLIIWHQALPHCATANNGVLPRMVQYIAYKPIKAATATEWK